MEKKGIVNRKFYTYICNNCGYNGKIREDGLELNRGCGHCAAAQRTKLLVNRNLAKKPIAGKNDIPSMAPWMIDYFPNGIDEAKNYTYQSSKKVVFKCPHCGRTKDRAITVSSLYRLRTIGCICKDSKLKLRRCRGT